MQEILCDAVDGHAATLFGPSLSVFRALQLKMTGSAKLQPSKTEE